MRVLLALALFFAACGNKQSNKEVTSSDSTDKTSTDTVTTVNTNTSSTTTNAFLGVPKKIDNLEVSQNDHPDMLIWDQAKMATDSLGNGWRLPTVAELQLIFKNKDSIGGFQSDVYWTSEESSAMNANVVNLGNGKKGSFSKIYNARIRPVRSL